MARSKKFDELAEQEHKKLATSKFLEIMTFFNNKYSPAGAQTTLKKSEISELIQLAITNLNHNDFKELVNLFEDIKELYN